MNRKTIAFAIIAILLLASVASAFTYATWIARAFKIGDGKWIDLGGNGIGNGSVQDLTCLSGCSGFNATGGTGAGNASYPINLSNASQATQIFSANTNNLTVTYLSNGNVSINTITIKGDTGATGANGSGNGSIAVYGQENISGDAYLVAGGNITLSQSGKNITISSSGGNGKYYTVMNTTTMAVDTVYRNLNTTPELQTVFLTIANNGNADFVSDLSNPPTTVLVDGVMEGNVGEGVAFTVIVQPQAYFKIVTISGVSVRSWVRWSIP